MTRAKLYPQPVGVDPTEVECPTCAAWAGWACGGAHCEGYHRSRIEAARATPANERKPL